MNKNKILVGVFALLCTTAFFSCKKEIKINTDGGTLYQPYYPMEIGKYITYDVDSSIWDDNVCIKYTHTYQMQYLIADSFRDAQKRLSYRIDVLIRKDDSSQFKAHDVFYITPAAEKLEFVEQNIRYIRLVNPVKQSLTWKGNSLLPAEDHDYDYLYDWDYQYKNVLESYKIGNKTYENTLTVQERDSVLNNPETKPDAFAAKLYSQSIYAYGLGMIRHEYIYWTYQPPAIPGTPSCRKGLGVVLSIADHN